MNWFEISFRLFLSLEWVFAMQFFSSCWPQRYHLMRYLFKSARNRPRIEAIEVQFAQVFLCHRAWDRQSLESVFRATSYIGSVPSEYGISHWSTEYCLHYRLDEIEHRHKLASIPYRMTALIGFLSAFVAVALWTAMWCRFHVVIGMTVKLVDLQPGPKFMNWITVLRV